MPHDPLDLTPLRSTGETDTGPAAAQAAAALSVSTVLLDLPNELLLKIAGKLDGAEDRMHFSQTNQRLRDVLHDSQEKNAAENQYAQDLYLELASSRRGRALPELCRQVSLYLARPRPTAPDRHGLIAGKLVEKAGSGQPPWWETQTSADLNAMIVQFGRIHRSLQQTGVAEPRLLARIDLLVREFGRLVDVRGDAGEVERWPGKAALARLREGLSDSDS